MPTTFFDLPREIRDEIYDWLWLDTPIIDLQDHDDIRQGIWYSTTETFPPTIVYNKKFAKMPTWPKTSRLIQSESSDALIRRGSLCVSPFPFMWWGRASDFQHSDVLHNVLAGALLSRVQAIELNLPLINLRRHYGDNLHVACKKCCMEVLVRYLGGAKSLRSLKISLESGPNVFWAENICINLGGLKDFWDATVDLDRFEISVEGRFGLWEGATTFNQSLCRYYDRLVRDIPTLEFHIAQKQDMLCNEVECSFIYKK
ncbi:hypothetical protein HBI56_042330 [Parastagonospora nodorum]|nr:hypothetical protein HBH56_240770 [Parastagonospora nodorum]QRC93179.1 hypothetical protein JI435_429070 [Parastagonospora nodorum SN15]KAH3932389.1 hypothetical protein HBH54_083670 [Parastagonospora nodorum]KAH3954691.1 hypothetical protein HBH53_010700 [Parastagonospora nodorum]KAH3986196.1 hypothetical protein HBH52_041900 [Parastagonospora nodorum]